nr:O-sialoglycoprotein endopeptidase [Ammoniphilus resinae]
MQGEILAEKKELLSVKQGKRGLQQSEAVFQHIKRLPELAESFYPLEYQIAAVAVSTRPRPVEGSYMPVFRVGESWARGVAGFLKVPVFETTHQEMHIAAGEYTAQKRPAHNEFLAVHLSGGTSELLHCRRKRDGYDIQLLGGTLDLHAGQLIDRIGVALGLPFPAGPFLEKLGQQANGDFRVPSTVKGYDFHFSGAETQLLKVIQTGAQSPENIARATEQCIANTLEKVIRYAAQQEKPKELLIVGGVAANTYMKQRLSKRLEHLSVGCSLYFADPAYSGDNAFGVARIGLDKWLKHE